jgi:hypothetical protein
VLVGQLTRSKIQQCANLTGVGLSLKKGTSSIFHLPVAELSGFLVQMSSSAFRQGGGGRIGRVGKGKGRAIF